MLKQFFEINSLGQLRNNDLCLWVDNNSAVRLSDCPDMGRSIPIRMKWKFTEVCKGFIILILIFVHLLPMIRPSFQVVFQINKRQMLKIKQKMLKNLINIDEHDKITTKIPFEKMSFRIVQVPSSGSNRFQQTCS